MNIKDNPLEMPNHKLLMLYADMLETLAIALMQSAKLMQGAIDTANPLAFPFECLESNIESLNEYWQDVKSEFEAEK